jgi:protein phosphatase
MVGVQSGRGIARQQNQDAWLTLQLALSHRTQSSVWMGLFALADGLGGHTGGAAASQLAVRLLAQEVLKRIVPTLTAYADAGEATDPIHNVLGDGFRSAHWRIRRDVPGAATTLTTALTLGTEVYVAHVGDTRLYLGHSAGLRCMTEDHSVAERLAALGQLDHRSVERQRQRLYRALGQEGKLEPERDSFDTREREYLLLCSDGVWGQMTDAEMALIVREGSSPQSACDQLIQRANQVGGEDDATAILLARQWPLLGP